MDAEEANRATLLQLVVSTAMGGAKANKAFNKAIKGLLGWQ